jgi:hypothetical protein
MKKFILIISCFLLFISCQSKSEIVETEIKESKFLPIFRNLYIEHLFSTPNQFGPIFNTENVEELKINELKMFAKGGKNPDKMLEKFIYFFNSKGLAKEFKYYLFSNTSDVLSHSVFQINSSNQISKIDIYKLFGTHNFPPVKISYDSLRTSVITIKANGNSDSLFFYPSIENPRVIIDKIGSFTNHIEIIVEEKHRNFRNN